MANYLSHYYPDHPDQKYLRYDPVSLEGNEEADYYIFDYFPCFDENDNPLNKWKYEIILGRREDFDSIIEDVLEEKLKPRKMTALQLLD